MTLILNNLPALHWALAGLGIAGITLALLLLGNRRLGISTGFEDICSLVLPAPYFRRAGDRLGPPMAAAASRAGSCLAGSCPPCSAVDGSRRGRSGCSTLRSGSALPARSPGCSSADCCIGFGTRLAGGCTSGHGIFGLANSRAAEPHHHRQLHGCWHRHHPDRLPGDLSATVVCDDDGLSRARHDLRLRR